VAASPLAIGYLESIPAPVVGVVLTYVMASQLAAGLVLAQESRAVGRFEDGLIIGVPLLLGTLVGFLPSAVAAGFPTIVRPLIANGFVVGIVTVLILEHIVYRRPRE
jgi:uracil permease